MFHHVSDVGNYGPKVLTDEAHSSGIVCFGKNHGSKQIGDSGWRWIPATINMGLELSIKLGEQRSVNGGGLHREGGL